MDSENQLISDSDGLAVIGHPTAVEEFLVSEGLRSSPKDLGQRLKFVPGTGARSSAGRLRDCRQRRPLAEALIKLIGTFPPTPPALTHSPYAFHDHREQAGAFGTRGAVTGRGHRGTRAAGGYGSPPTGCRSASKAGLTARAQVVDPHDDEAPSAVTVFVAEPDWLPSVVERPASRRSDREGTAPVFASRTVCPIYEYL